MQSAKKRFINRKKIIESSELMALTVGSQANDGVSEPTEPVGPAGVQEMVSELSSDDLTVAQIMERLTAEEVKKLISLNTLAVFLKYPAVAYNNYLQEIGRNRELEEKIEVIKTNGKSNREILDEIVQLEYRDRNI